MKMLSHAIQSGALGIAVVLAAIGCAQAEPPGERPKAEEAARGGKAAPLPLHIPISAVMTGAINRAAAPVFQAATSGRDLSDRDWLGLGQDAIDLVGAATLITLPGTGPDDLSWVSHPDWLKLSTDMQIAGSALGFAATKRDRTALTEAAAHLAQSCQSCHLRFSKTVCPS